MIFIRSNSLKPDKFLIPYLYHAFQGPGFLQSRFSKVQVFQGPCFSGSRFLRAQVFQGPGPGSWSSCFISFKIMQKQSPQKFSKKAFLKLLNIQRKTSVLETLFNQNISEFFRVSLFENHLQTAASENIHEIEKS